VWVTSAPRELCRLSEKVEFIVPEALARRQPEWLSLSYEGFSPKEPLALRAKEVIIQFVTKSL
jgi:hypothetical protein